MFSAFILKLAKLKKFFYQLRFKKNVKIGLWKIKLLKKFCTFIFDRKKFLVVKASTIIVSKKSLK